MAQAVLPEDEYWDGHTAANTIPFVDGGDALDQMVDAFDHGVIASKKVSAKQKAATTKLVGFGFNVGGSYTDGVGDDEMLSRHCSL